MMKDSLFADLLEFHKDLPKKNIVLTHIFKKNLLT